MPIENGPVCHVGWKDQAFVLIMSLALSGDERVLRKRKRPKETSSKATTFRVPFSDGEAVKELLSPEIADKYNHNMGAVNEFDHLTAQNAGLRPIRQGGHQPLEHWLFRTVLVNSYLLALLSDIPRPRSVSFRS